MTGNTPAVGTDERSELDKSIDGHFAIFQMNQDLIDILKKIEKKHPETKKLIDKELEKALKDFEKHTGLHETGKKVGSWTQMEFDNL